MAILNLFLSIWGTHLIDKDIRLLDNRSMELKDLWKLYSEYYSAILLTGIVFLFAGTALFYLMPGKYVASGSFFVSRTVEAVQSRNSGDPFTYEGYYAQQAALSYTDTVVALFESEDIKRKALESLGFAPEEKTLRDLSRRMRVTKSAPQLVQLTVKGRNPAEAEAFWNSLSDQVISTARALNKQGDPKLALERVDTSPVVKKAFESVYLNAAAGLLLGIFVSAFIITFRDYLKS